MAGGPFKIYLTFYVKIEPNLTGVRYHSDIQFLLPSDLNT